MQEKTVIRIAELASGCFILGVHAVTKVDGALILLGALLLGIPAELLVERLKK